MTRRFLFILIAFLLCACASSAPVSTPASTATFTFLPPTNTPIDTPTEAPTATAISLETMLPSDAYSQSYQQGVQYTLEGNKVFIVVDGNKVEIDPSQVGLNVDRSGQKFDNQNSLYPNIISVKDGDQTYAYDADYKGWFALYEGSTDVQKPTIVPYKATSDGRVLISLLLDHKVNAPFPEGTLYQGDVVQLTWGPNGSIAYFMDIAGAHDPTSDKLDVRWLDWFFQTTVPKGTMMADGSPLAEDYIIHFQPTKWLDDPQNLKTPNMSKFKLLMMASGPERSDPGQLALGQAFITEHHVRPIPLLKAVGESLTTGNIFRDSLASQPSVVIIFNLPGNNAGELPFSS